MGRRNSLTGRRGSMSGGLFGDDEVFEGTDTALSEHKAAFARFESKLRDEIVARQISHAHGLFTEGLERQLLWEAMSGIFENMTRAVVAAASEMQQADADTTRKQVPPLDLEPWPSPCFVERPALESLR
jgi:hypothetical protein